MDKDYRSMKHLLDLAILAKNPDDIKETKRNLEDWLNSLEDEIPPQTLAQIKKLIDKAENFLSSIEQATEIEKNRDSTVKNLSLRSKARHSHFKFMQQSIGKPKESTIIQPSNEVVQNQMNIHKSCPPQIYTLNDTNLEKKKDMEIVFEELEGYIISICLSKLKGELTPCIAKKICTLVQSFYDKLINKKEFDTNNEKVEQIKEDCLSNEKNNVNPTQNEQLECQNIFEKQDLEKIGSPIEEKKNSFVFFKEIC